mgnify:CR=1 FL=1
MKIKIISCSLHPQSRSFVLAKAAAHALAKQHVDASIIDLRELNLPFCDGVNAYDDPAAMEIRANIDEADAVLLAVPIYNYDVNAAAKNLLELGMRAWNNKIVGFLCAAGGRSSYMSVMSVANNLMLDFRCVIVPRFVYATGDDFGDDRLATMNVSDVAVQARIEELATTTVAMTSALGPVLGE